MIEKYVNITDFIPENFDDAPEDEQIKMLQDFTDYLHKEFGLLNSYSIILSSGIGDDIARFSINESAVLISKKLFDGYRSILAHPEKYKQNSIDSFKNYSYDLCCALVHELKHAQQYEKYMAGKSEYVIARYPVNNNMLYIIQPTEEEAYQYSINEMGLLLDDFKHKNILLDDEIECLEKFIADEKDDYESKFNEAMKLLENAKIIDICEIVTPYNYKQKLDTSKLDFLMTCEIEFVKERNDVKINAKEYVEDDINLDEENIINYKIKNKDGIWHVELILSKRDNVFDDENRRINFVLDNDTCRLNYILLENNEESSINGTELITYLNAFISLYPSEIKHIEISDFAYNLDYTQTHNFIAANTDPEHNDIFLMKSKNFKNKGYNKAKRKLEDSINKLPLEDKINVNKGIHIFPTKKVDIVR